MLGAFQLRGNEPGGARNHKSDVDGFCDFDRISGFEPGGDFFWR